MNAARKTKTAVVVSNRMNKTVVVVTERTTMHPLYKKYLKRRHKFKAHDESNECQIGDTVLVQETRPLSKEKHWKVVKIVEKAVV